MMEYTKGQIVFSKCGHDKGKAYIVSDIEGENLYLVDGKNRTLEKAKKKKNKHVQITGYIIEDVKAKLEDKTIMNSDLIKALKAYKNKFLSSSKEV